MVEFIEGACPLCANPFRLPRESIGRKARCHKCKQPFRVQDGNTRASTEHGEIIRYSAPPERDDFIPPTGDAETIDAISDHIATHIGPIHRVFHEIVSDIVHIDVHWVQPTTERPYHALITSGMSDLPMEAPDVAEEFRFAELFVLLPVQWRIEQEALKQQENYWPIHLIKWLARFPHHFRTWLCNGHTIPNGDPPKPYAPNTKLCCALLTMSPTVPFEFHNLEVSHERKVHLWSVVPLYREEMDFKLAKGSDALIERFGRYNLTDIINIRRRNVCARRFWPF